MTAAPTPGADDADDAGGRRVPRALVLVAALLVSVGLVVAVVQARTGDDRISASRSLVDDDSRWTTGSGSGEALAVIAERLLAEANDAGCGDAPPPASRCAGLLRSAAWAEVSALLTLRCTQPFVVEVRANARAVVDALVDGGSGLVNVPAIVRC